VEVAEKRESKFGKAMKLLLPSGIGGYPGFWNAFKKMSVKNWVARFEALGFELLESRPLLIYAPSEWPVVPTMKPRAGSVEVLLSRVKEAGWVSQKKISLDKTTDKLSNEIKGYGNLLCRDGVHDLAGFWHII
jgi:hypothetical protein